VFLIPTQGVLSFSTCVASHDCRAAGLSRCRSLSSCFLANRLISAVTISILRFVWRSVFWTYQGNTRHEHIYSLEPHCPTSDLRFRPHGHWYRLLAKLLPWNLPRGTEESQETSERIADGLTSLKQKVGVLRCTNLFE